ncbi:Yip1 family protein [Paludifilum halophilum]|uniref:Yip1 family protein n=1 Tax=Paludifilum halophilum TaxID=1642702 RepID=UPI00146A8957|nr:Yip1 family protein [Paludifilum halophilum]
MRFSNCEYLKTIWLQPRKTISELLESDKRVYILFVLLAGIGLRLDQSSNNNLADQTSMGYVLISALLFGPIIGLIAWFFYSGLTHLVVRWFGGSGTWRETRLVFAWSTIPMIAKLLLWIPLLLFFGSDLFTAVTPTIDSGIGPFSLFMLFGLLELILSIWFFVILSQGLSEVHGFSAWKGFWSVIFLPLALVVLIVLAVILIS